MGEALKSDFPEVFLIELSELLVGDEAPTVDIEEVENLLDGFKAQLNSKELNSLTKLV